MAVYDKSTIDNSLTFKLKEQPIYGSSRLGIVNSNLDMSGTYSPGDYYTRTLGIKQYEGTNHLGNVISVFTDIKIARSSGGTDISSYMADVVSATDYYPFGMMMPGRKYDGGGYRFAFNGMEKDEEIKGVGNSYTTEFRQYDSRIGRWLSLDPAMSQYADWSPYNFGFNNPIFWNDPKGDCPDGKCNDNDINRAEDVVSNRFNSSTPNGIESVKNISNQVADDINKMYADKYDANGKNLLNSKEHQAFLDLSLNVLKEKIYLDRYAPEVGGAFNDAISSATSVGERADLIAARSYEVYIRQQSFALQGLILEAYAASFSGTATASATPRNTPQPFTYNLLYSHAHSRSIQRGITPGMIDDALTNPLQKSKVSYDNLGRPSVHYIGRSVTVVKNPDTGKNVTVWKTSTKLVERLVKQK